MLIKTQKEFEDPAPIPRKIIQKLYSSEFKHILGEFAYDGLSWVVDEVSDLSKAH
jgi:hypothetical protein